MIKYILFETVVLLTNIIQCITGFAGTVLAMPAGVLLVGYDTAKPILNVLGLGASAVIIARDWHSINTKEFLKMASVMLIGVFSGIWLGDIVSGTPSVLYKMLGITVIVFAVLNAVKFYTKKEEQPLPALISFVLLIASGVVHGMFVCGGPLLVTYAGAKLHDKAEFRSTLSAVWVALNALILAEDAMSGVFTLPTLKLLLVSIAVLGISLFAGNLIYKKLSRSVFLQLTYVLMLVSGIVLILK